MDHLISVDNFYFDRSLKNFAIIRISIPIVVPSKYSQLLNINKSNNFFLSTFYRENDKWFIRLAFLSPLLRKDLETVASDLAERYRSIGLGGDVVVSGDRSLIRSLNDDFNRFYNSIADLEGTKIYPFALMGEKEVLIGFEYTDGSSSEISKLLLDFIRSSEGKVGIRTLGRSFAVSGDIPAFYQLYGEIFNGNHNFIMVKTEWQMTEDEMNSENGGIFLNRCIVRPKYFDVDSVPMIANIFNSEIRGKSGYKVIESNADGKVILSEHKTYFFSHIRKYLGLKILRPFYFWSYSDGKGNVNNFFIMEQESLEGFLEGIYDFWNDPMRRHHNNTLKYIGKIDNKQQPNVP